MPRTATVDRKTAETDVRVELNLDGAGHSQISTGVGFFDHMLTLLAKHAAIDLNVTAKGDLHVDQHHTVEDVGIVLGQLCSKALGDRKGINRAGYFVLPMDETLAGVALDLGGRPALVYKDRVKVRTVGDLPQGRLHEAMARRRVYLHPMRWTSLGLSLIEAMHLGMPVVALARTAPVVALRMLTVRPALGVTLKDTDPATAVVTE